MDKLRFHHLKPTPGSTKKKLRKGRGEAGKRGKTAGRGTKGTGARKTVPAYFEGGQIPLYRRIPKLKGIVMDLKWHTWSLTFLTYRKKIFLVK